MTIDEQDDLDQAMFEGRTGTELVIDRGREPPKAPEGYQWGLLGYVGKVTEAMRAKFQLFRRVEKK